MNRNPRIKLEDRTIDVIVKLAEGNPGALRVCADIFGKGAGIDKAGAFGGLGALLMFDSLAIYGESIWLLYKHVCGQSLEKTIAVPRAWQLGFVSEDKIARAIEQSRRMEVVDLDVDELLAKVKERLGSDWVSPVA